MKGCDGSAACTAVAALLSLRTPTYQKLPRRVVCTVVCLCAWLCPAAATPAATSTAGRAQTRPSAALLHALIAALRDWEPGLVAIIKANLEAQSACRFIHLEDGGAGLAVSPNGRRVTNTRRGRKDDWAIATPGVQADGSWCVAVTVHQSGWDGVTIGVIAVADPSGADHGKSFHHPTANGWINDPSGGMYRAGEPDGRHDGWPDEGWHTGDVAAMRLDSAAKTLTLKHRRFGWAFTIAGLQDMPGWFVNVSLRSQGDSVELQPMTTAAYDAFLVSHTRRANDIRADGRKFWPGVAIY